MTKILCNCYIIPRSTSALRVEPGYVKPLLEAKFNANRADRSEWVKKIPFPADIPASARQRDVPSIDDEALRLASDFGTTLFRSIYPTEELFAAAVRACSTDQVAPGAEAPDLSAPAPSTDELVQDFLSLNVPTFRKEHADTLIAAGLTADIVANVDLQALAGKTGLSIKLLRSLAEVAREKFKTARVRSAPSAPTELRATFVPPGAASPA